MRPRGPLGEYMAITQQLENDSVSLHCYHSTYLAPHNVMEENGKKSKAIQGCYGQVIFKKVKAKNGSF